MNIPEHHIKALLEEVGPDKLLPDLPGLNGYSYLCLQSEDFKEWWNTNGALEARVLCVGLKLNIPMYTNVGQTPVIARLQREAFLRQPTLHTGIYAALQATRVYLGEQHAEKLSLLGSVKDHNERLNIPL